MSDRPFLPLPSGHIPDGTRDWRAGDARRWLDAGPARWSRPWWAVLALLATCFWAIASTPVPVCSESTPCGPAWTGTWLAGLALLQLYWVWRLPDLARLTLAPAGLLCVLSDAALGRAEGPARVAVLLALGFALLGTIHRVAAHHRQQRLALDVAGPARHALPPEAAGFGRGRLSLAVGSVLLAAGALAGWQGAREVADDEARADRATVLRAEVARQDEDGSEIAVLLPGEEEERVVEAYAEDYPVGSEVAVLVDGDRLGLVAEPYDAFGWQTLMLLLGVPGLAFLGNGLDGRLRAHGLRAAPLPTLRVLVAESRENGRTVVYAVDDPALARPVLSFTSLAVPADTDDVDEGHEGSEGESSEERRAAARAALEDAAAILKGEDEVPPVREGVLYGAPRPGGELALVADAFGEPMLELSTSPVRPAREDTGDRGRSPQPRPRRSRRRAGVVDASAAEAAAARLGPSTEPLSWSAGAVSRGVGFFLLFAQLGMVITVLSDGPGLSWVLLLGLPVFVGASATALCWRITADRQGLWVTGAWRVRHIPWERLTTVRHEGDDIRFGVGNDPAIALSFTGAAWLERRLGHRPRAVRAVEEIRALHRGPELRPARDARPADHGAPIGPVVLGVIVLAWVTQLLLG
ncbi:hypothetical protein [Streptomyces hainanensis]|uniref:Uncharacterized protein n=1 Tax=Streptomyces hainanensis TaxID=402648 RepID=A0A4R4TEH3_9ACTN|nr:hypothetical protein [Streptomyces hainanensis]TDC75797.1 hypothetical protein E1283_11425 [Streptomyces hainanensis]